MRAVTSATPPAPNGKTILIGFSGQAAFAPLIGASISTAAANTAQRRVARNIPVFMCISSKVFVLMIQNHKSVPDCPLAYAFAPAHQARIAEPDQPDRPRRPRASHSDVENPCPTAHDRAQPRPAHAQSAQPRHKAA